MVAVARFSLLFEDADRPMSVSDSIDHASRRLTLALDALEAAAERREHADRTEDVLADQVHALGTDRARMAGELDAAAARTRVLETANREVARRIDHAIEAIRGVLVKGNQAAEG